VVDTGARRDGVASTIDAPQAVRRQFIGGTWTDAAGGASFEDRNPFTGEVFAHVAAGTRADAARAVAAAAEAFPAWAATPPQERQRLLLRTADIVERRADDIRRVLAEETGGGSTFANFQLSWITKQLRQASGWAYLPSGEVIPSDMPGTVHMGIRRPLGVVAGFSPWNGANLLAWRTIIPPLVFGNTVVLKPSEHAPVAAGLLHAEILEEAGFPPGTINVITHAPGEAGPIADELCENRAVRAINFTGSTAVGRILAERAGRHLKRIVLELGGYNPLIVLADADLDYAVEAAAFGAFMHQGQVCMNARKAIVARELHDEFVTRLAARANAIPVGDPSDPATIIGPLISPEALARVERDVADAVGHGATVAAGGSAEGPCYRPTILTGVPEGAHLYREETFGPVLVVQPIDGIEEAIRIANDHDYGLSAGILTGDADEGLRMAGQIESGMVRINDQTLNDEPQMPLGGTRDSGWGRAGPHSVEDFTQLQWVSIQSGTRPFPF
jgi:acyl-CoA reductase-like NAD-dependent aldehyde dehydrogenase